MAGRRKKNSGDTISISAKKFGNVLVEQGVITEDQRSQAIDYQFKQGRSLKEAVMELGFAEEEALIEVITELKIPPVLVAGYAVPEDILRSVPAEFAFRNRLIPLSKVGDSLTVAMSDPFNMTVLDELRAMTRCSVMPAIAREKEITEALRKHYGERAAADEPPPEKPENGQDAVARQYADEFAHAQVVELADGVNEQSAPVVKLSIQLVEEAHKARASAIHIEPFENKTLVRFRVDGVLHVHMKLPRGAIRPITSRYKIMAGLDISERRVPQDGRIRFKDYSGGALDVDLRVSTVPVAFGEKVVMRILAQPSTKLGLAVMGFSASPLERYRAAIRQPYGRILHAGRTGSGNCSII